MSDNKKFVNYTNVQGSGFVTKVLIKDDYTLVSIGANMNAKQKEPTWISIFCSEPEVVEFANTLAKGHKIKYEGLLSINKTGNNVFINVNSAKISPSLTKKKEEEIEGAEEMQDVATNVEGSIEDDDIPF